MLTKERNERLTRVGRGTPCGELLRHYWHALCPEGELPKPGAKKRVRILGEDLVVFRNKQGKVGCIEEHCLHRGASLYYGFVEDDGIRCCYHGWKYCMDGACTEQPFEKHAVSGLKALAYPVESLGGLLFVYMGPHPENPPPLPRWDVLASVDRPRQIRILPVHNCNWLQIQENTVDMVHTYYLHGQMAVELNLADATRAAGTFCRPIKDCHWTPCEWGIEKAVTYDDNRPNKTARWPPFIFPTLLRTPERIYGAAEDGMLLGTVETLHLRVPIDDTHTSVIWVALLPKDAGKAGEATYEYVADPVQLKGEHDLSDFYGQDRAVWETQGVVSDRTREHLGSSDGGIALFRKMLDDQIDRVGRGELPNVGVVRTADRDRTIDFIGRSPSSKHGS